MTDIREIPSKFKTSDGREFAADQEEAAKRHQNFLDRNTLFEQAVTALNIAMAGELITADGHPFTFERSTYYYVMEGLNGENVISLSLWARHCTVETDGQRSYIRDRHAWPEDQRARYDLANLYRDERKANLRVLEIKKQRLGWLQDDIKELAKKLGIENTRACLSR